MVDAAGTGMGVSHRCIIDYYYRAGIGYWVLAQGMSYRPLLPFRIGYLLVQSNLYFLSHAFLFSHPDIVYLYVCIHSVVSDLPAFMLEL